MDENKPLYIGLLENVTLLNTICLKRQDIMPFIGIWGNRIGRQIRQWRQIRAYIILIY